MADFSPKRRADQGVGRGPGADLGGRPTKQPNPHHFHVVHPWRAVRRAVCYLTISVSRLRQLV
jgi:hypothetical protein